MFALDGTSSPYVLNGDEGKDYFIFGQVCAMYAFFAREIVVCLDRLLSCMQGPLLTS